MGITISFAGNPRIKPTIIIPSIPIKRPKGSRKEDRWDRRLWPSINRLPASQMMRPARCSYADSAGQDEQSSVENRAYDDFTELRTPVRR